MAKKIEVRFIIEIAGKPIENVDKALNIVLDKLKLEKDRFKLVESHIGEPELDEVSTLYGGFIEAEAKFEEVKDVIGFILDYTPTSIEVLEPSNLELSSNDLTDLLNHLSHVMLNSQHNVRQLTAQIHLLNKKLAERK